MAVCTFVLLITANGPQCSRQFNFSELICSRSGASTPHPCHEPRKFLSMSMNLPDNGRLMTIRSTHFEATDDHLLPFSRFNIFDLALCSKLLYSFSIVFIFIVEMLYASVCLNSNYQCDASFSLFRFFLYLLYI